MSTVTYLVFESSPQTMNMNKINVFKNGSEMPWTYYQSDIIVSGTNPDPKSEAKKRLMFTSEAKRNTQQGLYVSQITKYVQTGTLAGVKPIFKKASINNPTIEDYKNWDWKLSKNELGEEILPSYGEFKFIPGCEPSYEDLSSMDITFKFGFGLNNTCYNFATETTKLQVYNLSCAPKVFCSANQYCNITYNNETKMFSPDLIEEGSDKDGNKLNEICCDIKEGLDDNNKPNEVYLYIAVESGETLNITAPYIGTALAFNQIDVSGESGSVMSVLDDQVNDIKLNLTNAYRRDITGEETLEQASVGGNIRLDFFRLALSVKPDFREMCYNAGDKLQIFLNIKPKAYGNVLEGFERTIKVQLNLTPATTVPRLDKTLYMKDSVYKTHTILNKDKGSKRQRLVVTAKEAINYAIKNNTDPDVPEFLKGNDINLLDKYNEYKRSSLTETEKALDNYKRSFDTLEMKEKLALYIITELSTDASNNLVNHVTTTDLSFMLANDSVKQLLTLAEAEKKRLNEKLLTIADINAVPNMSKKFQDLMNNITKKATPSDPFVKDTIIDNKTYQEHKNEMNTRLPWNDTQKDTQRQFGSINTDKHKLVSGKTITTTKNVTLIGCQSTLITLLYALNNKKNNGSDVLVDRYIQHMKTNRAGANNELDKLYNAMKDEYHNRKNAINVDDGSGVSYNRPFGLYNDLYNLRYKLNPVDGKSGINYLRNIIGIGKGTELSKEKYGTGVTPTKTQVSALLYGSAVTAAGTHGIGISDLAPGHFLTDNRTPKVVSDILNPCVFYSPGADFSENYSGFSAANDNLNSTDVSNFDLVGEFVYNNGSNNQQIQQARPYSSENFHPENLDFSGDMIIPHSESGKYTDVYVLDDDGFPIEIKETIWDNDIFTDFDFANGPGTNREDLSGFKPVDSSNIPKYTDIPNSVINLRKTIQFKTEIKEINFFTVGIYQVYRLGNVLHWMASVNDLDSEILPAMRMPRIGLKYRFDVNLLYTSQYTDIFLPLKDVESTLRPAINKDTTDIRSGILIVPTVLPGNSTEIVLGRWGTSYIALDISGQLERGEVFGLSLNKETYNLSTANISENTNDLSNTLNDSSGSIVVNKTLSVDQLLPKDCEEQQFVLEYMNTKVNGSRWLPVGDKQFEYECHRVTTLDDMSIVDISRTKFNTHGDYKTGSSFNHSSSSNVKGAPRFRVCIPSQNNLLQSSHTSSSNNALTYKNFGTLIRNVEIDLKYSKSAKLKNVNSQWINDSDGNNKTLKLTAFVKSDAYNSNISSSKITYTTDVYGKYVRTIGTAKKHTFEKSVYDGTKVVSHAVTKLIGDYECKPDYSKLHSYDFSESHYSTKDGVIQFVDAEIKENKFGIEHPIAIISFDNYRVNGKDQATAKIVPLFQRRTDENDWETDNTQFCKRTNLWTNSKPDADKTANRMIPQNTNYGLIPLENGKMALYRKTPINYEKWVGGTKDIVNGHNFFDETNRVHRELVVVKVTYYIPNELFGSKGQKEDKYISFMVQPKDCTEISWSNEFDFEISDGDKSIDITSVISAKIEGTSNENLKYYIRGWVDEKGMTNIHKESNGLNGMLKSDWNKIRDVSDIINTSMYSGITSDIIPKATNFKSSEHDLCRDSNKAVDLRDLMVNGRLTLYHKNAHKVVGAVDVDNNPYFDAWTQSKYTLLIEAVLVENNAKDKEYPERFLSTLNINVTPKTTGFRMKPAEKYYISILETMGTINEGKTSVQNNPLIKLSDFVNKIQHDDIGINISNDARVSFAIKNFDNSLEVIQNPDRTKGNFIDQFIRLKDIPMNKTTECPGKPISEVNAHYAHYNYERKKEYSINLEVSASSHHEITVKKVSDTYICELGRDPTPTEFEQPGNMNWRTSDYKMDKEISSSDMSGLFYFCDPVTRKFHGPLSTMPQYLNDLTDVKQIHGANVNYAYVRDSKFKPLFKTKDFKISDLPPKPIDHAVFPFTIKVTDSYDKPKVCPQPYTLDKCIDYYTSDPKNGTQLDNTMIKLGIGSRTVGHVYCDHVDLTNTMNTDFEAAELVPAWHPKKGAPIYQVTRKIHPNTIVNKSSVNTSYAWGKRNGTPNGNANGSFRYGLLNNTDNNENKAILDYFVESHGCIDVSGRNELSKEYLANKPEVFGTQVDYSGTISLSKCGTNNTKINISNTDKRLYRLDNIQRSKLHHFTGDDEVHDHKYSTATLKFNDGHSAKIGDIYNFSIAAVTNILATSNDISYNHNMVDFDESFYVFNKIDGSYYPQPFQKYAYDASGERIVTLGYAMEYNGVDVSSNAVCPENMSGHTDSLGALLVCRTHFTVCVEANGATVTSTDANGKSSVAKGLNFDSSSIVDATLESSDGDETILIIPATYINASDGDIKLFNINGDISMGVFKNGVWDRL